MVTPLCSTALFLEYEAVLSREEIRQATAHSLEDVAAVMSALAAVSEGVDISFRTRPMLSDVADEMVLEAALNGQAEAIVTHNVKDFRPALAVGVTIATPGDRQEAEHMTQTQRYKYPLQLPQSLKETAARLAHEDGVSLNQWIVSAVAQKIGAVETADFLKAHAGAARRGDLTRLLTGHRMRRRCRRMPSRINPTEANTMTRAALYARYSSDNQREASIEDQFRLCREHAARERWQIVGSYEDAAISGASTILRPGIQRLMRDAQQGEFNILLAEALDRISRDQADVATLYKHLKFAGVTIVTLAEDEISELHVGLKGTMNALFLKDLAMKTHRGLRGRVEKGKAGGGLCYGYRVVKSWTAMASRSVVTGRSSARKPRSSYAFFASLHPVKPQGHRRRSEPRWRSRPAWSGMG